MYNEERQTPEHDTSFNGSRSIKTGRIFYTHNSGSYSVIYNGTSLAMNHFEMKNPEPQTPESRGLIGWIKRKISSQEKHPVNGLAQDGRSCLHGSSGPPTMTGTLHRLPAEPQYQDNPEEDLGFNGIPSLPNLNQDASHQLELRDYSSNASYTTHRQPGPPREPFDQQIQAPSHSHSTLDAIPVPALAFNNTLHFVATEKNEEKDDNEDMEDQGDMGTVGR